MQCVTILLRTGPTTTGDALLFKSRTGVGQVLGVSHLLCDHVWLACCPSPHLHRGVWVIVCQAALLGMNKGRRLMGAATLGQQQQQERGLESLPGPARLLVSGSCGRSYFLRHASRLSRATIGTSHMAG